MSLIESKEVNTLFSVFPNPSTDYITVKNKTDESFTVYLSDIFGKSVYQGSLDKVSTIDISDHPVGTYFLIMKNGNKSFVKQIIIE